MSQKRQSGPTSGSQGSTCKRMGGGVQKFQRGSKYFCRIWTRGPTTTGVQILRDRHLHCEIFAPSAKSPIKLISAVAQIAYVPITSLKIQCASIVQCTYTMVAVVYCVVLFVKFDVSISLFHEHLHGLEWTAVVADVSAGVSYCNAQG